MPINKSIYKIEVDDSQFKDLKRRWDQFNDAVKALPDDWKKVTEEATSAGVAHQRLTGSMEDHVRLIVQQEMASKEVAQNIVVASSGWSSIVQHAKDIDRSLERSIVKLAKWGTLATGVLGGLGALGIGASLFGLDRLAASVTATRRSAMSLGMTYGGYQAAGVNYQRFSASPGSILENAAEAKTNIQSDQYRAMLMAGVSDAEISAGPEQSVPKFLENLPRFLKKGEEQLWGSYVKNLGFDQIAPMSDIRAYMDMSPAEQKQARDKAREDAKNLNVGDKDAKIITDFFTQMERAGKTLEARVVTALSPLAPDLTHLSEAVVGLVQTLVDSGIAKELVTGLGDKIDEFATYIDQDGGNSLKKNIKDFVNWVGSAATEIWNFLAGLGLVSPLTSLDTQGPSGYNAEEMAEFGGGTMNRYGGGGGGTEAGDARTYGSNKGTAAPGNTADAMRIAMDALSKEGVPPEHLRPAAALLVGEATAESTLNPNAVHDNGTGYGIYGAHLERRDAMLDWLSSHGYAKNSLEGQIRYMAHGMMNGEVGHKFPRTREALLNATPENIIGNTYGVTQEFESPAFVNPRGQFVGEAYRQGPNDLAPRLPPKPVFPEIDKEPEIHSITKPNRSPEIHSVTKPNRSPEIHSVTKPNRSPEIHSVTKPNISPIIQQLNNTTNQVTLPKPQSGSVFPHEQNSSPLQDIYNAPPRLPVVSIRNNTGNNPVLAHAQNAAPTTSVQT